ncbi:hypothetical protein A9174_14775 [Mesorhizobium loti NZP2037]|nr:hypothetical protein A9174_14775 [Mesorhizobium loti NZP2037]
MARNGLIVIKKKAAIRSAPSIRLRHHRCDLSKHLHVAAVMFTSVNFVLSFAAGVSKDEILHLMTVSWTRRRERRRALAGKAGQS